MAFLSYWGARARAAPKVYAYEPDGYRGSRECLELRQRRKHGERGSIRIGFVDEQCFGWQWKSHNRNHKL